MGVEFRLYERNSKEFIHLGKRCSEGFQLQSEVIAAFLKEHAYGGTFEMHSDNSHMPDEDDEDEDKPECERWKRRANWWSKSLDDLSSQE